MAPSLRTNSDDSRCSKNWLDVAVLLSRWKRGWLSVHDEISYEISTTAHSTIFEALAVISDALAVLWETTVAQELSSVPFHTAEFTVEQREGPISSTSCLLFYNDALQTMTSQDLEHVTIRGKDESSSTVFERHAVFDPALLKWNFVTP